MDTILQNLGNVFGLLIAFGTVIVAFGYLFTSWKNGKNDYEKRLVETMKELLSASDVRINELQNNNRALENRIFGMEKQLEMLTKTNGDLSQIMKAALIVFFEKHPEQAIKISKEIA